MESLFWFVEDSYTSIDFPKKREWHSVYEHVIIYCFIRDIIQLYIGSSRTTVVQNRDVCRELKDGMLVAVKGELFPQIGIVKSIPHTATLESSIEVEWLQQERAPHKPTWLGFFKKSTTFRSIFY